MYSNVPWVYFWCARYSVCIEYGWKSIFSSEVKSSKDVQRVQEITHEVETAIVLTTTTAPPQFIVFRKCRVPNVYLSTSTSDSCRISCVTTTMNDRHIIATIIFTYTFFAHFLFRCLSFSPFYTYTYYKFLSQHVREYGWLCSNFHLMFTLP